MPDLKLVGLCGSMRKASTNRMLLNEAARLFGPASYTEGDLNLPLYNGDIENGPGIPAEVQALSDLIGGADAVILTTPEYNKGVSGVLKNALDWISRTKNAPWKDKPIAVISAAAGTQGGARANSMLRTLMLPFNPLLIPGPEVMLGQSAQQFDAQGRLTSEMGVKLLTELTGKLRAEALRMRQG
ncbi:NADPH-dependent FMN reductase [Puniceibacterium sediminis]|uniref:Chromate reductase n=1 Tax=Puniceibacterium sediminis TaxID=1608407 RepID=A0A238VW67_9RHOB|nr:NAD(P)H-dependent oxidoreductase [Puniceibacterium sediminis]SNR38488.1 chromate reductase [Puniceibacterium sediminis]